MTQVETSPIPYAGFGRRLAAHIVDTFVGVMAVILTAIAIRAFAAAGIFQIPTDASFGWDELGMEGKSAILAAFLVAQGALYFPLCHSSEARATIGKRLANIHVNAKGGDRLSFARALARWLVQVMLAPFGFSVFSALTILTDEKQRAIHDFAVGSAVLMGHPTGRPPWKSWRVAVAIGAQVAWLVVTFTVVFDLLGSGHASI